MIVDQSQWGHIKMTGGDRLRFLQGMCTANVAALEPGQWTRASMLNTKGRVTSIIEILCQEDHLLVSCEPSLADKTLEILSKYAVMDEVEFEPVVIPVHRVWNSPRAVWDAPPLLAPPPAPPASQDEVETRRIEAGFPRYGVDVGESHFPFESLLGQYIDYEKGCYLGQEPVARVHFRGQANKGMRGLALDGEGPIAPGSEVQHTERPSAGTVTSSTVSPTFGPIALAYLHRSVIEAGGPVTVTGRSARIVELPFGS